MGADDDMMGAMPGGFTSDEDALDDYQPKEPWTEEQDNVLMANFEKYKDMPSCNDALISLLESECGADRTSKDIDMRLVFLKLKQKPRKKKRSRHSQRDEDDLADMKPQK